MKTMKSLFSAALALLLVFSLTPSAFASTAPAEEPVPATTTTPVTAADPEVITLPETTTDPVPAPAAPSWSILQPVNYWQDPGYAVHGVYAEDLGDGQTYLYVFFENGEVVGMNSDFIAGWLSCGVAYSWKVTGNSLHTPLMSYAISALLSGNNPWVTISDGLIILSNRIQTVPRRAAAEALDGMADIDEVFINFLKRDVDVYTIGAVDLEMKLDDWFFLLCAEIMQWQPREEEVKVTTTYIYVPEWGVRFQVPQNLVASYAFNSQTNTLTVTGTIAKSLQYLPEFASFDANPNGLGAMVYLPGFSPDNPPTESYGGRVIECNGHYFAYYHPQAVFSADPDEQSIEVQAAELIQQMLTEGIESF